MARMVDGSCCSMISDDEKMICGENDWLTMVDQWLMMVKDGARLVRMVVSLRIMFDDGFMVGILWLIMSDDQKWLTVVD